MCKYNSDLLMLSADVDLRRRRLHDDIRQDAAMKQPI